MYNLHPLLFISYWSGNRGSCTKPQTSIRATQYVPFHNIKRQSPFCGKILFTQCSQRSHCIHAHLYEPIFGTLFFPLSFNITMTFFVPFVAALKSTHRLCFLAHSGDQCRRVTSFESEFGSVKSFLGRPPRAAGGVFNRFKATGFYPLA